MAAVSRGRILLVDPESGERARVLRKAGFEVKATSGGAAVRPLLEKERFDAVVSEVSATNASGFVRAVRRSDKDVPVILIGDSQGDAAGAVVEQGAACLPKAVAAHALERTLDRVVRKAHRWRPLSAYRNRRGEAVDVASFTATDAKNEFGRVLQKATDGLVVITRHDEPEAVVLSFDEFKDLAGARDSKLDELSRDFDLLLARMQTRDARRGMKAAFDASPARMGAAAVAATRKRG